MAPAAGAAADVAPQPSAAAAELASSTLHMPTETLEVQLSGARGGEASTSGRDVPQPDPSIARAAAILAAGGVVAIPTETVYGLAANALSPSAVARIYAAKGRPSDNPLIVHISSIDMLRALYPPGWELPPVYAAAVRDLWPGPLTILLPRSPAVADAVTCGLPTMAVRMPAHPVALRLMEACGFPLAAPSANSSGRPSPTLARHVTADLGGRIPLVLDGGPCACGVESTVLDGLRTPPAVLRPGGVTVEQLAAYGGLEGVRLYRRDFVDEQLEAAPTTPGMKYRHYSPTAAVVLLDPGAAFDDRTDEELAAALREAAEGVLKGLAAEGVEGQVDGAVTGAGEEAAAAAAQVSGRHRERQEGASTRLGWLRTSLAGAPPGHRQQPAAQGHPARPAAAAATTVLAACGASAGAHAAAAVAAPDGCSPCGAHRSHQEQQLQQELQPPYEYVLGHVSAPAGVAAELFAGLRGMDERDVAVVVVEGVRDAGPGVAVMNRLRKAASRTVHLRPPPPA